MLWITSYLLQHFADSVIFVIVCQKVTVLDTKSNVIFHPTKMTRDRLPPHRRPRSRHPNHSPVSTRSRPANSKPDKLKINYKPALRYCPPNVTITATSALCYPPIITLNFLHRQFHFILSSSFELTIKHSKHWT